MLFSVVFEFIFSTCRMMSSDKFSSVTFRVLSDKWAVLRLCYYYWPMKSSYNCQFFVYSFENETFFAVFVNFYRRAIIMFRIRNFITWNLLLFFWFRKLKNAEFSADTRIFGVCDNQKLKISIQILYFIIQSLIWSIYAIICGPAMSWPNHGFP